MMENGRNSRSIVISQQLSMELRIREKLISSVHRLHEAKTSFVHLKSEVIKGLAEAKEVFTSISIPLVRLVDLKVKEMDKDGRKTVVLMTNNFETFGEFGVENETFQSVLSSTRNLLRSSEGVSFKSRAAIHAEEILNRQKCQIKQLMALLKMIESFVRTQEQEIAQRFDDHQDLVSRMQKKFVSETSRLNHRIQSIKESTCSPNGLNLNPSVSEQGYKALLSMSLKLQQAVFEAFRKALIELKDDMDSMVNDLASRMCQPLMSYMKQLSSEGVVSIVRQFQKLVEQMDTDFVRHVPALLVANDRLLLQLRNSEMESKELQKRAKSLKNALSRKGEETEDLRKRMRTQAKRIQEVEMDNREIQAQKSEFKQVLCAKDRQIVLIRDEAVQKSDEFRRQMSALREENIQLKQIIESKVVKTSSQILNTDKMTNSSNELRRNKGDQMFSRQKPATQFMMPSLDQKMSYERPAREEKVEDEFLWKILEPRQKGISRSSPGSKSRRHTNNSLDGSSKVRLPTRNGPSPSTPFKLGDEALIWEQFPGQQGPITRSCAQRMMETPSAKKSSPALRNRSSPSHLPWNLRILGKRDSCTPTLSPNGFRSPPWHK